MPTKINEIEFAKYGDRLFGGLISKLPEGRRWRLLFELELDKNHFEKIRRAAANFLSVCLQAKPPLLSEPDVLDAVSRLKSAAPNITPNGLVRPKREHVLEFNLLHKSVVEWFQDLQVGELISTFQIPLNLRIVEGKPDSARDSRPYATAKLHSDIWVGDPLDAVIVHLPLFGDSRNIGVEFAEIPPERELDYMKRFDDYAESRGVESITSPYDLDGLKLGRVYFADARLLHATTRKKEGLRISLDFRFRLMSEGFYRKMADKGTAELYNRDYLSYSEWCKIGLEQMIVFDETSEEARARWNQPQSSLRQSAEHRIVDLFRKS